MPSEFEQFQRNFGRGLSPWYVWRKSWSHSPRVNGQLKLQPLTYSLVYRDPFRGIPGPKGAPNYLNASELPTWGSFPEVQSALASARNNAYGRLRGRLYSGKASLGVTIASAKQSRDMVQKRFHILESKADRSLRLLEAARTSRKPASELARWASGFHLEVIFGWVPLVQDIVAATTTVVQRADDLNFVRGSSQTSVSAQSITRYGGRQATFDLTARVRVTYACGVQITNRNRWLQERAGLLNVGAVALDLVPWSFVANMFVNVNSLVNSVTDFSGLSFNRITVTEKFWGLHIGEERGTLSTSLPGDYGRVSRRFVLQNRSVQGSIPRPTLEFRRPELTWETAAMAGSLFTQKFRALSSAYQIISGRRR